MEGAYDYIVEQGWENEIPRSKVYHINNGVDLEQFDYNTEHFRVDDPDLDDPNTFKVVYTGSIRKANGLGILVELQKLILAHNSIESLKEDLRNLPQLTVLNVNHNRLSKLPVAIGEFLFL